MQLTKHQKEKLDELLEMLEIHDKIILAGDAGVGKTVLINFLIKELKRKDSYSKIVLSATTNQALGVLKSKTKQLSGINFMTIHKAMNIRKITNNITGETYFGVTKKGVNDTLKKSKYLIIDETSMLNKDLFNAVMQINKKIIFVGDFKQLNPVKELVSAVFSSALPIVELTEIIRQNKNSSVIHLSRNLDLLKTEKSNRIGDDGYIFTNDLPKIINTLAFVNGKPDLKYLAWTNLEVNKINNLVRKQIYGEPKRFEVGETLIFDEPYKQDYSTGDIIEVVKVKILEKEFKFPSQKIKTALGYSNGFKKIKLKVYLINENIIVLHEDEKNNYQNLLMKAKKVAYARLIKFSDIEDFKSNFTNLKYNHAITIHKSQGSTFKQAILALSNINLNRNKSEKEKLLYTAVTRVKELLIIYKK